MVIDGPAGINLPEEKRWTLQRIEDEVIDTLLKANKIHHFLSRYQNEYIYL